MPKKATKAKRANPRSLASIPVSDPNHDPHPGSDSYTVATAATPSPETTGWSRAFIHNLAPELMLTIFELLTTQDMSSAARVCKYWSEIAIPMLWRVHTIQFSDLVNVLQIRSASSRSSKRDHHNRRDLLYYMPERPISASEWNRFVWLSKHIKTLTTDQDWQDAMLLRVLHNSRSSFGGDILPNLRAVTTCQIWVNHAATSPEPFFHSSLRTLNVQLFSTLIPMSAPDCDLLLEKLQQKSPYLQNLTLSYFDKGAIAFSFFDQFHLKTLKLDGPIHLEALESILRCNTLRTLSLTNMVLKDLLIRPGGQDDGSSNHPQHIHPPRIVISGLEELELGLKDIQQRASTGAIIWDRIACPNLKQMWIVDKRMMDFGWVQKLQKSSPLVGEISLKTRPA
ncbi:hypothetical protein FRC03_002915 [Tulasnella sp. 419]|nr:hypothetical protein FRC03_002915 [Tulasnella sp. 419]